MVWSMATFWMVKALMLVSFLPVGVLAFVSFWEGEGVTAVVLFGIDDTEYLDIRQDWFDQMVGVGVDN